MPASGRVTTPSCIPSQEIFLTYIAPCHYNAVRRRTSSLPRIFALSRSTSSIEAAMRQAEKQGLPRDQVWSFHASFCFMGSHDVLPTA